jgi:hypothetical protein
VVDGLDGPRVESARGRACVWRFTWASILTRCLRMSSSLSFMENTRDMKLSAVGGREIRGGWKRTSNMDSSRVDSSN